MTSEWTGVDLSQVDQHGGHGRYDGGGIVSGDGSWPDFTIPGFIFDPETYYEFDFTFDTAAPYVDYNNNVWIYTAAGESEDDYQVSPFIDLIHAGTNDGSLLIRLGPGLGSSFGIWQSEMDAGRRVPIFESQYDGRLIGMRWRTIDAPPPPKVGAELRTAIPVTGHYFAMPYFSNIDAQASVAIGNTNVYRPTFIDWTERTLAEDDGNSYRFSVDILECPPNMRLARLNDRGDRIYESGIRQMSQTMSAGEVQHFVVYYPYPPDPKLEPQPVNVTFRVGNPGEMSNWITPPPVESAQSIRGVGFSGYYVTDRGYRGPFPGDDGGSYACCWYHARRGSYGGQYWTDDGTSKFEYIGAPTCLVITDDANPDSTGAGVGAGYSLYSDVEDGTFFGYERTLCLVSGGAYLVNTDLITPSVVDTNETITRDTIDTSKFDGGFIEWENDAYDVVPPYSEFYVKLVPTSGVNGDAESVVAIEYPAWLRDRASFGLGITSSPPQGQYEARIWGGVEGPEGGVVGWHPYVAQATYAIDPTRYAASLQASRTPAKPEGWGGMAVWVFPREALSDATPNYGATVQGAGVSAQAPSGVSVVGVQHPARYRGLIVKVPPISAGDGPMPNLVNMEGPDRLVWEGNFSTPRGFGMLHGRRP